jgi:hypothetical protein
VRALKATASESEQLGYFRLFAKPPGGTRREITIFRGAPVLIDNASFADPFTHQTAQISLPQVTIFDMPGSGDLDWLVPDSDIDIVWQNTGSYEYRWRWEGFIVSYQIGLSGASGTFQIDLKGALYGLDDYLAIPSFPKRPIPYEILIARAFDQREHPARLGRFQVSWPSWWDTRVPEYSDRQYLSYLKPWGVTTGQLWTGFTSRSTGTWEPMLTGHVQSLTSVMFAEGGAQWSIRNRGYRRPELYLRTIPDESSPNIIEITLGAPGVDFSGSRDFTQRASVIYGQGVDDAGVSYSGMTVSPDGKTTTYKPFAYAPQVWPRVGNPNFNREIKPKEVMIRFQDGVDQISAQKIAMGQLQRFAEPGITGSITLSTDVRFADGVLCPRMLIQAGDTLRLKNFFGLPEGLLVHVTNSTADFQNLTMTLDFDSKYRDQLTVEEVKARTRDALTPMRALQVGKYSNTVQDLVLPWSYAEGSGCVPMASKEFFNEKIPSTASFPYEEWTTKHPPKDPASRPYYIKLRPTDVSDSTNNWSGVSRDGLLTMSIPVRMSQAGTIRLTQLAAYDRDGNVLPVKFHFSVYAGNGVSALDMPRFPDDPENTDIKYLKPAGFGVNYGAGQANPFFENAWEKVNEDGTTLQNDAYVPAQGAELRVGWGNYFEPAGYSPGRFSRGATPTGMLEDHATWTWDLSNTLDLQSPENNANEEYAGMLFVMIYCDDQGDQPVFFMGRMFRQEPGTQ